MDNDDSEEAIWSSLNSRLELPAEHGRRHHRRSLTSGSLPGDKRRMQRGNGSGSGSPEEKMNTGRARTPPVGFTKNEEYFPRGMKRDSVASPSSVRSANSANSGSSVGSSALLMKQR